MALLLTPDENEDFDEEAADRDEFEIEDLIRDFIDEPSIRHDQCPESDDEEEKGLKKKPSAETMCHIKRGDGRLYTKQTFFNGVAFKECVLDYALRTGRNIKQYRYDKEKIGFKCAGCNDSEGCEWQIYASVLPSDNVWIMHCGICGEPDHNSRFHTKKQRPTQVASEAASQGVSQAVSAGVSQAASQGGCHVILGYNDMC